VLAVLLTAIIVLLAYLGWGIYFFLAIKIRAIDRILSFFKYNTTSTIQNTDFTNPASGSFNWLYLKSFLSFFYCSRIFLSIELSFSQIFSNVFLKILQGNNCGILSINVKITCSCDTSLTPYLLN
jgi:hypothetical protein